MSWLLLGLSPCDAHFSLFTATYPTQWSPASFTLLLFSQCWFTGRPLLWDDLIAFTLIFMWRHCTVQQWTWPHVVMTLTIVTADFSTIVEAVVTVGLAFTLPAAIGRAVDRCVHAMWRGGIRLYWKTSCRDLPQLSPEGCECDKVSCTMFHTTR